MSRIDLAFIESDGNFDISIGSDGDLLTVSNIDTAIDMSILLDAKADKSEVIDPLKRRGWFGDMFIEDGDHSTGIKDWLFSQARLTDNVPAIADDYAQQSLEWLENNNIGTVTSINSSKSNDTLSREIKIKKKDNSVISRYYNLWDGLWQ